MHAHAATADESRAGLGGASVSTDAPLELGTIYSRYVHDVARWVRAFGGAEADLDDLTQEVFIVVGRKLPGFDGENLAGWIYRIADFTVRNHRRRAWFRRVFSGGPSLRLEDFAETGAGPSELLEEKEGRRLLAALLEKMSKKSRAAFVLFEIEGYSGEQIAALEGIPLATVWTRLHHARKQYVALVAALREKEGAR